MTHDARGSGAHRFTTSRPRERTVPEFRLASTCERVSAAFRRGGAPGLKPKARLSEGDER